MKDFIHLLKFSYNVRKNKIHYALLAVIAFLILLTKPAINLINPEIYKMLLLFFPFISIYSLFTIELNMGKSKQNGKDNYNTSLLYHYSLLQSPKTIILVNFFEIFIESLILTIFLLAINFSFSFYIKTLLGVFFFWYMVKSSQVLFVSKRFNYFASTNLLSKINILNIALFVISTFLTIHFISNSKFDLFNYIEQEYFLIVIALFFLNVFIFSSIYNLEQDSTPKILSNQTYLIINILFFIISFVLSDPFYRIYRQDQYIFSLISKENTNAIDLYLTTNPQYINIENNKSSTPLIKALSDKLSSETILTILKHQPNLKAVRKLDGKNALVLSIENCQMPVIKKLIELGVDIALQPPVLFSIHRNDCFEAYPFLKKNGADMKIKNKEKLDFIQYGLKYNSRFKDNFNELNELYHFE